MIVFLGRHSISPWNKSESFNPKFIFPHTQVCSGAVVDPTSVRSVLRTRAPSQEPTQEPSAPAPTLGAPRELNLALWGGILGKRRAVAALPCACRLFLLLLAFAFLARV